MDEKKVNLNDEELSKTSGGSHLSSDEVKSLPAGTHLILENPLGIDLAEVEYLGEYEDPGPLSMLKLHIRVIKRLTPTERNAYYPGADRWESRYNLDFMDRA